MSTTFKKGVSKRIRSPHWSYLLFFIIVIPLTFWALPASYQVLRSDFLLMAPKYKINRWAAGEMPINLSDWKKLEKQLKLARSISPDNPDVLLYLGNLNALRGFLYETDDRFIKAYLYESADYYLDALNLKPVDPLLWVNYAKVLSQVAPESDDYFAAKENANVLAINERYLKKILDKLK